MELINTVMETVGSWSAYAFWIGLACFIANLITMLTPTKVDDKWGNYLLKALNFVACNIWKNKNADAELARLRKYHTTAQEYLVIKADSEDQSKIDTEKIEVQDAEPIDVDSEY